MQAIWLVEHERYSQPASTGNLGRMRVAKGLRVAAQEDHALACMAAVCELARKNLQAPLPSRQLGLMGLGSLLAEQGNQQQQAVQPEQLTLEGRLSAGATSVVWKATIQGTSVALKVPRVDCNGHGVYSENAVQELQLEGELLSGPLAPLQGMVIPRLFMRCTETRFDHPVLIMEYLEPTQSSHQGMSQEDFAAWTASCRLSMVSKSCTATSNCPTSCGLQATACCCLWTSLSVAILPPLKSAILRETTSWPSWHVNTRCMSAMSSSQLCISLL